MATTSATMHPQDSTYSSECDVSARAFLTADANPGESLRSLLLPLQRLDQRLTHMIEVASVLKGTAFEGYLLGSTATDRGLLTDKIATSSRLARLKVIFELSDLDIDVLLLAISPEIDRRYERLYAQLQQGYRKPTIALSVDLLCCDRAKKECASERFSHSAPLIHFGLIQIKTNAVDSRQTFTLNPVISDYLRGLSAASQLSSYVQMSWPEKVAHITNSPILPDLLHRLHSKTMPTPLMLRFVGEGAKEQSARAIAIAAKRPLLTVSLEKIFHDTVIEESLSELFHKTQQILLQARLWNAVVYVKDAHKKLQASMAKFFFERLSTHSGITIFAGHIPAIPHGNNKGIIPIPFIQSNAEGTFLRTQPAQITLRETELFRQKLLNNRFGLT